MPKMAAKRMRQEVGLIPKDIGMKWRDEAEQISRMLAALIKSRSE